MHGVKAIYFASCSVIFEICLIEFLWKIITCVHSQIWPSAHEYKRWALVFLPTQVISVCALYTIIPVTFDMRGGMRKIFDFFENGNAKNLTNFPRLYTKMRVVAFDDWMESSSANIPAQLLRICMPAELVVKSVQIAKEGKLNENPK